MIREVTDDQGGMACMTGRTVVAKHSAKSQ